MLKEKIQHLLTENKLDDLEFTAKLKSLIYEFETDGNEQEPSEDIFNLFHQFVTKINNKKLEREFFQSGFKGLDNIIGGFNLGEFIVVGARPSMGKTQFLLNIALHVSKSYSVLYFTFDESKQLIMNKIISTKTGIKIDAIMRHAFSDSELEQLKSFESEMKQHQLFINDSFSNSLFSFSLQCEKAVKEDGVKMIIVDYLQLMTSNKYKYNRDAEISSITKGLKKIAKQLNVVVIASSQLNRALEQRGGDKRPILSDLRESGAIEMDADKVFFLYRPDYYGFSQDVDGCDTWNKLEIIIAKNKVGIIDSTFLKFNNKLTSIIDLDENDSTIINQSKGFNFSQTKLDELEF